MPQRQTPFEWFVRTFGFKVVVITSGASGSLHSPGRPLVANAAATGADYGFSRSRGCIFRSADHGVAERDGLGRGARDRRRGCLPCLFSTGRYASMPEAFRTNLPPSCTSRENSMRVTRRGPRSCGWPRSWRRTGPTRSVCVRRPYFFSSTILPSSSFALSPNALSRPSTQPATLSAITVPVIRMSPMLSSRITMGFGV